MSRRQDVIAHSITHSVLHSEDKKRSIVARIPAFFYLYWLSFECVREDLFKALRGTWHIDSGQYRASFSAKDSKSHTSKNNTLEAMGDMGYSGSTFYVTQDASYIVKSIPRIFEHSFFKNDLLIPYAEYMREHPDSLLVRITDFLECSQHSIGSILGLAPSHHIVMENIKHGESEDKRDKDEAKWEAFDLKPMSYFYPERDIAGGLLSSEATKSKLADEFDDKVHLTLDQAERLKGQLEKDTAFLAKHNSVDYSLFLIRIPASRGRPAGMTTGASPSDPLYDPPLPESWRTGVKSMDSKFVYRAVILDFFWAKHTVHAKAMTGLIKSYNIIDPQGPMSVTAESSEYRERFLKMSTEMVEARLA